MRMNGSEHANLIVMLALVGLLVTGCVTVGPDFKKPEVPVAESWLNADDHRVDTTTVADRDWWAVLTIRPLRA